LRLSYSQFGTLENDRGGSTATTVAWHVKAVVIRISLGVPEARIDLSRLSDLRHELGAGLFTSVLAETVGDTELTETVISWLDQWDSAEDNPA
jgi:hypothetical protein